MGAVLLGSSHSCQYYGLNISIGGSKTCVREYAKKGSNSGQEIFGRTSSK